VALLDQKNTGRFFFNNLLPSGQQHVSPFLPGGHIKQDYLNSLRLHHK
jgi:hypothetical protein